jgi:hypothetical protein
MTLKLFLVGTCFRLHNVSVQEGQVGLRERLVHGRGAAIRHNKVLPCMWVSLRHDLGAGGRRRNDNLNRLS